MGVLYFVIVNEVIKHAPNRPSDWDGFMFSGFLLLEDIMKNASQKAALLFVVLCLLTVPSAWSQTATASEKDNAYDLALLSAVSSLADAHLQQTRQTLEVLARTSEVRSGEWKAMEELVRSSVPSALPQIIWFVRPDGAYYTTTGGLADQKLSDRPYFPKLMSGHGVLGDLVVSKATGKKSVIIAVPVSIHGKIIGGLGASIFVDDLSRVINRSLKLPPHALFYGLATNGLTSFHINPTLDFVDPRNLQNPSLTAAAQEILNHTSGDVTYEYNGASRHVYFCTSPLTGWRIAYGRVLEH